MKSTYLNNLINGNLTGNYNSKYLSNIWANNSSGNYNTYRYNILNNFTNENPSMLTAEDYLYNLKTNQTVFDMSNPIYARVTLDSSYLPIALKETHKPESANNDFYQQLKMPADYLPARITSVKGSITRTIPILFPISFSRSIRAQFAKENPIGSTLPIVAYSYTDAEEIPLEFDALADYLPASYNTLKEYIDDIIDILKPQKTNNIIYEPTVVVEFADMYFKGICNSVSISYDNIYNYKSFVHARISCQFTKLS